ncbi:50S ribosomal protein L23, chloroplastic [Dendrobium catenatum]|uniref:50S ribosomal protein L23, chloroplastic n=1 Tax=Dendrobium catenatum TaxID=906689 RepID=A0A2I0VCK8_9ASPA|nr:50S ribosomal protein L23, chloroplastic [Dendrobium catenatum]
MESNMQYLQKKVFGYWGTINRLLMSNQDRSISERNGFELFFGVKVIAMNSHRLPGKKG